MADFTIKGNSYKSGKMDLFRQFDVLKRIGPFVPALTMLYSAKEKGIAVTDAVAVLGQSMLSLFAQMSDEDARFVANSCLDIVQRKQGEIAWANIKSAGGLMFQDIDLFSMGNICWVVLEETFSPFFADLRALSPAAETTKP